MGEFIVAQKGSGYVILKKRKVVELIITTERTGYTCLFIYGEIGALKYESIVVPTYKLELREDEKLITTYNVTRDAWYCRGLIRGFFRKNRCELSNRCFEPADANLNLYSTTATQHPKYSNIGAYALRQNGSEILKAAPHTKKMNTRVDGSLIDDEREKLDEAKGVMIHIGGWYYNPIENKRKLAGSYGCFGIVPKAQVRPTEEMAETDRITEGYKNFRYYANDAYMQAINFIVSKCPEGTTPRVLIKKRDFVKQHQTIYEVKDK
jgi:hypothetical protein